MEAGHMPHLQSALASGVSGDLLSTVPPVTALAWPSFMTGKNPGQHGLLGWQGRLNARFERPWISGRGVKGAKLWHLANRAGLRACVFNVPVTYPPEPLDGVMVTGMLTPGLETEFTYPAELKAELLAAIPDYRIDLDVRHTQPNTQSSDAIQRFLDAGQSVTRMRGRAIRWLLDRERPQLAVVVFELPDRLQHILWRYIAELPAVLQGAQEATFIHKGLLACYQTLDEEIGRLLERLPATAYRVFLSDHGFGPWGTNVYLSDWLAQRGWLAYDRRRIGGWEALRWVGSRVKRWLPGSLKSRARRALPLLGTLDWSRTRAYPGLPTENGVFINVRGREPAGIVEPGDYEALRTDIITALREWRDGRTGEPVMTAVYRREDLYSGPFVDDASDVIFEPERGYRVSDLTGRGSLLGEISEPWGFHEREGIYGMSGPGIVAAQTLGEVDIMDVMPTLLYALGLPVPDDLDGRALLEIFSPDWRSLHPLQTEPGTAGGVERETDTVFTAEDAELIEERLKGLGYLD
jgi:predicted AlkP superfamily phosphohydrolase/phosphomutase